MMVATIPVISPLFKILLDSIGWVLAWLYQIVPNYGVAIVVLTIVLRVVVLPLGIKQIKSMGAMQAIQPKVAEIKKKYKGNSPKIQEETMKLYKDFGVSPLGGCLPMLLQFPLLIAMYSVIKTPGLEPTTYQAKPAYAVLNSHLPPDSTLFLNVLQHERTTLVPGLDLACSARDAGGQPVQIKDTTRTAVVAGRPLLRNGQPVTDGGTAVTAQASFSCGSAVPSKIPYFVLLALMVATTFYQQYQMQRVTPPGSSSQQQQALLRIMPLMFGFLGFSFPAGLVLYWTIANVFMIGQQGFLFRAGHIGPEAIKRQAEQQRAKQASAPDTPRKRGWLGAMMERAEEERRRRGEQTQRGPSSRKPPPGGKRTGSGSKAGGGRGGTPRGDSPRGNGRGSNPRGSGGRGSNPRGSGGRGSNPRSSKPPGTNPRRPPGGSSKPRKPETGGDDGS
jgi:YidC/Oxa1 family membrane protein insertase